MRTTVIDTYEKDLLQSVEKGEWKSVENVNKEKLKIRRFAKYTQSKLMNVTIDVSEEDFKNLKRKSIETGIPYQNIITALIHNYSTGRIKLTV